MPDDVAPDLASELDLDLRKLRYFAVVAEELHFGRAADRLHMGQPALSRQIRALEADLQIRLFERSSHGTALTAAGAQLLGDARVVLDDAVRVRRRLERFRTGHRSLTVGVMPGLLATSAAAAFERQVPGCRVAVVRLGWANQLDAVRTGAVDIAYAREVSADVGLTVQDLLDEPRDVVLPRHHDLAGRGRITPADLRDDLLLQDPSVAPEWVAVASAVMRRRSSGGAAADTVEEKLELVAAARGFVVLPHSTTAAYRRPDVVVVPAEGFSPSRVSLVWLAAQQDDLRDRFVAVATRHAAESLAG
jgi:DNA-binding transcriptional LysR family regulator